MQDNPIIFNVTFNLIAQLNNCYLIYLFQQTAEEKQRFSIYDIEHQKVFQFCSKSLTVNYGHYFRKVCIGKQNF